jgi:hypothetical protein
MAQMTGTSSFSRQRHETIEFRVLFGVCFVIFLMAAIVARILHPWRLVAKAGDRKSVVGEARSAAHTCIPFAFMS